MRIDRIDAQHVLPALGDRTLAIEEIEEPTMREIRYRDKLVDELAKGRAME